MVWKEGPRPETKDLPGCCLCHLTSAKGSFLYVTISDKKNIKDINITTTSALLELTISAP
jgi:hypothetical protein